MMSDYIQHYRDEGYAIIRNVFSRQEIADMAAAAEEVYQEGLRLKQSWRHKNLYFEVIDDKAGGTIVRQVQWVSWCSPRLEAVRRDKRILEILEPMIGKNLKQLGNQIHWKRPGAKMVGFRYHQDARFRTPPEAFRKLNDSFVQTGLAIDPHRLDNGALKIFPGSHKLGYLGLSEIGYLMKGNPEAGTLAAAGLDPAKVVNVLMEPGDVTLWHPLTVHGSGANTSQIDRRIYINGYATAENTDRGEWAFRDGIPCPLGAEPALVHYEDLYKRPEPHYVDNSWAQD
ncbi:phytanoyl-CoA dioxygenase family protein [Dongia soli]|uniref:Phytanoyl-CoA dioxygenase family protein n=1 Tax=Dongia soli TaxID=600628 RepID=A0ABU5EBY6_9PROT|nr:phytanoyl-CoA dioxygenase family protein [Dongia soli]MDY0882978.1 phytanoyl-CoA dioxygenase family protein [Dongia soli]